MYEKGKSLKFDIQGISCLLKYCYACSIHLPFFAKSNFEFPYQKKKLKNLTNSCKLFFSHCFIPNFLCYYCSVLSITPGTVEALAGILL